MATEPERYDSPDAFGDGLEETPEAAPHSADAEFQGDPRLASGVPEVTRADELDFIEMTGLTRPNGPAGDDPRPYQSLDDGTASALAPAPPPVTARAIEAADDLDDSDAGEEDDALERALAALSAAPPASEPPPPEPPDVESIVSKVRDEILEGIRGDLSELRAAAPAPDPVSDPVSDPETVPAPAAPPSLNAGLAPALREAERLVQELQDQPRETEAPPPPAAPEAPPAAPPAATADPGAAERAEQERRRGERRAVGRLYEDPERDVVSYLAAYSGEPAKPPGDEGEVEVDFSGDPPKHSHRSMSKRQRAQRRVLAFLLVVVLLVIAGYMAFPFAKPYLQTPGTLYREAERLEVEGNAREASNRYRAFLSRYPNDPRAAEALFRAGFVLQVEESGPVSPQALADSTHLLQRFIDQYPDHDKTHRARTLRGILLHRLGEHEEAVTALRNPALHLADPAAALPVWRTLAQAYRALGDPASARSEYLKAASLQGNYSADEDYEALGRMYKRLAEQAGTQAEQHEHLRQGITYLRQATLVPGISRDRSQALQREIDFLSRELDEEDTGAAPQDADTREQPALWHDLEAGDPTEPAIDPADALTVLDGLESALPDALPDTADVVAPVASPDPVFDAQDRDVPADEMDEHTGPGPGGGEYALPDEVPVLNEGGALSP